jgi:hypothetical protein
MNTKTYWQAATIGLICFLVQACGNDKGNGSPSEKPFNKITFTFFAAAPLTHPDLTIYQLWAKPHTGTLKAQTAAWVSLGRFQLGVDLGSGDTLMYTEAGSLIPNNTLSGLSVNLKDYDSLFITLEPTPIIDTFPAAPSASVYLQGDIPVSEGNRIGALSSPLAQLQSVPDSLSRFVFDTPTDDDPDNPLSGVWFVSVERRQGLYGLVTPPPGWIYEGWALIGSGTQRVPVSTGRFADPAHSDLDSSHSGPLPSYGYPGEDFLHDPPPGAPPFPYTFVQGDNVAITVEPNPDPDPSHPFPLAIFTGGSDLVPGTMDFYWLDAHPEAVPAAQALFGQED